ncbi:MAG TPA: MotA/TolQ/ExbB proton channel family protein [Stellaceae bacterium]|nr:MotA/TolQ/ExbB proton channel family protein [Stellaceae bacterium]
MASLADLSDIDRAAQSRAGQTRAGQDGAGQDRAGLDRTGQDRTGQDRTGLDRSAKGRVDRHWYRPRAGRDMATLLGFFAAFGLLAAAMFAGGSPLAFIDLPAVLIVLGGTAAVTTVSFSLTEVRRTHKVVATALIVGARDPRQTAHDLLGLADQARRSGALSLEDRLPELRHDGFLLKAIALVVDTVAAEEIERVLRTELHATLQRHRSAADVLRRAAEVAPAMGLIGTLVGLVQMLGNLNNPASIGPSMAIALLTTFYGAVLANMVLLPLAAKLERNSQSEALDRNLVILAATAMARQDSPRRLELLLNSVLPPAQRVRYFD